MTQHDEHAHGGTIRAYILVFLLLSGFTIVSFAANWAVRNDYMPSLAGMTPQHVSFMIILAVAIVKAVLVAMIFMHLKWDWGKLYFMICPAFILAPFLVLALLPDIVLYWKHVAGQ